MKYFQTLNIKNLLNHKLFYDSLPKNDEEFGIDNICVLKENLRVEIPTCFESTAFELCLDAFDNIVCQRQSLEINVDATKLHVLGFSYWGDKIEYLDINYANNVSDQVRLILPEWSQKTNANIFMDLGIEANEEIYDSKIVLSSGRIVHPIYFHHNVINLNRNKIIESIILPDNMFMHIFAITLERESEEID